MNAFVTGGSRGIGRSIVLKYIEEGWGVAFTYSSNKSAADETIALAQKINAKAHIKAYELNLANVEHIEKVCEKVVDDFQDIEAVVNNAAIVRDNAAVLMSNEEWSNVIAVNLTGPFIVSRSFLMHMLSKRYGRFIHISSLAGGGSSGQINYASSKAALDGLSNTIAKEYGAKGIGSNVVTVGYVPTEMTKNNMTEHLQKYWVTNCPAKRVGTGEEIASTVFYLSTKESSFLSGENIKITGGLTYAP